jgi:ectoine hydroxylase-related dioxygenase (phytanoyl-CoA dioxygenase family)
MLSAEQIAFYRENGYLLVPGLLTPAETSEYRQECHSLAERLSRERNIDATWGSAREAAGGSRDTVILHCHDTQFHSAAFTRLLVDPRFVQAASELLGSPNVQLHHTKMFIKPPEKGSPFPMHQDYPYFPHERHTMMAAIFFFDDAPEEKGCVRVYPGSHRLGPLEHSPEGGWHLPVDEYPLEKAVSCPARAGDVLFFSYLTIHGSGLNTSSEPRTTLLVQFRDPEDRPTQDVHRSRGQGMMLAGIDPLLPLTGPGTGP